MILGVTRCLFLKSCLIGQIIFFGLLYRAGSVVKPDIKEKQVAFIFRVAQLEYNFME